MRLIKLAVISIAALFLLATILSALFPSRVIVSRAVDIAAPADSLLPRINDLRQWRQWVEGMQDPSVEVRSASQARLGKTEVTITGVSDTAILSVWQSTGSPQQVSTIRLIGSPGHPTTIVQWQFEQHLRWYPWEKLGSIMNDKIMGPMMEKNLANLKKLAETAR